MEFIVTTELDKALPQKIDFNFEELKAKLSENLEKYRGALVTPDTAKEAKADRAALNKLKMAVDKKRIDIKKQYMTPYNEFEEKVKELLPMINEPIMEIDGQIKALEEKKKEEKLKAILDFYGANIKGLRDLIPFEKLFDKRWLNSTFKLIDATQEMLEAIEKAEKDIQVLKAMKLKNEDQVLDAYLQSLDMSAALAEKNRFEEQQKKLSAMKKAENIVRASNPEASPIIESTAEEVKEATNTIKVIFYDTTEAFRHAMRDLCHQYGIKYGGIR